jgi:hypothetical protein
MLCHLCSQLERYAYLDGNNTCHSLPDYNLEHLQASDKCDLCQLLLSKALLYPQVREDGIHLGVTSGKALWLAKNGDAVTITRFLGCRYLWIGSLYIVQDSAEDWQRESAKMRQSIGAH